MRVTVYLQACDCVDVLCNLYPTPPPPPHQVLPDSVGAIFYLKGSNCAGDIFDGPKCEDYARAAHRTFLDHFGLTAEDVPLVAFDLWNVDEPFSAG